MESTCLYRQYDWSGAEIPESRCQNTEGTEFVSACVHEHVDKGIVCDDHLPELNVDSYCGSCDAIDGHDCPMHVTIGASV